MNNIYKVIWSKAKNCYVVASEIARSHTKSASGSEKIGGGTRRKLLASLMALSLLCGGLGVAEASVHVVESGETYEVLTTQEVKEGYGTKADVEANKNNIAALQTKTTEQGQSIATNVANIANNTKAIERKIDTDTANERFAAKADLTALQNQVTGKVDENTFKNALGDKADTDLGNLTDAGKAAIKNAMSEDMNAITTKVNEEKKDRELKDDELSGRIDTLSTTVDSKVSKTDLNTNYYTQAETNAAIKTAVDDEKNARENAINGEVTERNKAIADAIAWEETNRDAAITNAKTELKENVTAEETNRKEEDAKLEGKITENTNAINNEKTAREAAVTDLSKCIGTVDKDGQYIKKSATNNVSENLKVLDNRAKTNADDIAATNKRTAGIDRIDAKKETTIESNVTVDSLGNVTAQGKLKGEVVDAGAVNAGSLSVENASQLKGDVTMDKTLSVTGDTTLKGTKVDGKLTVTDEADLKNTTVGGTLGVTGEATFKDKVTMEKDLEVKGELKTDKISMKNTDTDPDGTIHRSATTITADGITHNGEVEKSGVITKSQFTHTEEGSETYAKKGNTANWTETRSDVKADGVTTKVEDSKKNRTNTSQTADGIKGYATDKVGNKTYTKVTATENSFQVQDKDGKNKNHQVNTMGSSVTEIKNDEGKTTKTEQTAENITNTAKDGTIKNDAKDIVNNASGNISNKSQTMDTTVTGKATESYGSLDTTVNGNETHIVKGTKTETVDGKVTENYNAGQATKVTGNQDIHVTGKQTNTVEGGQENIISGGQINSITGDQTTTVTGDISNKAENITNEANTKLTDKVGDNTRVLDSEGITDTVPGADGKGSTFKQRIDAIMGNVKTDAGESEVTQKGDEITSVVGKGEATNSRVTQKKGSLEAAVTDGINTNVSYDVANASAKELTDGTKVNKVLDNLDSSEKTITNGTYKTSKLQTALDITNTAKDGTITNDAKDIVNNASGNMTNTVGGDLTTTVSGNELHEVAGKQTNKIDGDQENTIGGNQTTTVTGDISNKAENITNEANTKLTDKVGENTRVLDSEGITDTVGGSTFKQRIDKIMMESKDVSIKAEETLTNEAKVITNKASEVINNEAVSINNTATGIITSKASEIKNQADKLISNKVGENTWENMENGKITTSIKDGAKQNLTQSDAAGTTQSTVDGGKSTVTIQNADGLADAVTDGTNTSVQNQTASAIAAAVKDGAGNENASVANATTSVNTIKSGSKANTVISTADGTSFINSEAAAPVGDGTEVKTTIKGNTITTGKVTMDYAEVMKDLGVRGNANIAGKTTTGELEVTGKSTLKGDVTMESNATVKKDLTVEGTTTTKTLHVTENATVGGTLDVAKKATFGDSVSIAKDLSVGGNATITGDVTAKSYKVGDKTYISADGINANDQKITNVADGSISEGSKDAVNGGQLYGMKRDLEHQVDKVGANAAAMANLRPMEFDPDSKWNIAAAMGNYGSETAAALGAFYRPNDDVMVNLSTAFGTGENMVGGGVSVRLGKGGNKLSREESNALKAQVADLTARMDALLSVLNPNMSKDFPDVPENHWAYEAVSRLAGNDIVQGYPDGEFHGERTMTRYEMAEIIYNALSRGAEAEKELVEEFKPELQAMAASEKATAE